MRQAVLHEGFVTLISAPPRGLCVGRCWHWCWHALKLYSCILAFGPIMFLIMYFILCPSACLFSPGPLRPLRAAPGPGIKFRQGVAPYKFKCILGYIAI